MARELFDVQQEQRATSDEPAIEILGDSEIVINWMNGTSLLQAADYSGRCELVANHMGVAWQAAIIATRAP